MTTNLEANDSRTGDYLTVLVPTRGRPEAAVELAEAFQDTCTAETRLVFVINEDDPTRQEYSRLAYGSDWWNGTRAQICYVDASNMVEALNLAAMDLVQPGPQWESSLPFAVGFMGDDHRPRTKGWDSAYLEALHKLQIGIVYGDDLMQGRRLPTQCAMTASLIRIMGYMAPPTLTHLYVDNAWLTLGQTARCIRWLPEVIVEHMHPAAGKADWDAGHLRVNDSEMYSKDEKAFADWLRGDFRAVLNRIAMARQEIRAQNPEAYPQNLVWPGEWRLFEEGTIPEYTTPEWYKGREHTPHLEQAGHRDRLIKTASFVAQAAFTIKRNRVVDLGCGDGGLLSLLGPAMDAWGYDLMPENVSAGKSNRRMDVRYGDVVAGEIEWGDIAVATEMLEHLVDPHAFVRRIAEQCQAIVCSSPWDETAERHYEFHTWAWDMEGYRALVEQAGFKVIRQGRVNRFQVLLGIRDIGRGFYTPDLTEVHDG